MSREKMIGWLVENVQVWPYFGATAVHTLQVELPAGWHWQFHPTPCSPATVVRMGQTITMSDWNNAAKPKVEHPRGVMHELHTIDGDLTVVYDWVDGGWVERGNERAQAVSEMMNELPVHNRDQHLCELLYDAGYRHVGE